MRPERSKARILNKAAVPVPGEHYGVPARPYQHRDARPGPKDTYDLDGVSHTYDGKCHADCENVR